MRIIMAVIEMANRNVLYSRCVGVQASFIRELAEIVYYNLRGIVS